MHRRHFLQLASSAAAASACPGGLAAQAVPPAHTVGDSGNVMQPPVKGFYPYSGVSGPGHPAGPNSGSAGVAYQGAYPPSYPTRPWLNYATGSAVKNGLLPPIRPLLDVHVRDTVICLGGDGHYYMTGSTGDNIWAFNDGVELWRSPDLRNWEYLGLVWSLEKDATWEKQWRGLHGLPSRAIWAPEIHFLRGNYYIALSMAPGDIAILRSQSGDARGPYVHAFSPDHPLNGGIDATLFEDTDGKVYYTWGSATRIVQLKDDLSGYAGDFRNIVLADPDHTPEHHAARCIGRGMNDLGTEGAVLFKANGVYYLGAADDYQGRYSSCMALSDNIFGPYHSRHESVPCGGGTGFFQDKEKRWWQSYFGNDTQSPFLEKPAIVRIDFDPQGRVVVARDQPFVPHWKPAAKG